MNHSSTYIFSKLCLLVFIIMEIVEMFAVQAFQDIFTKFGTNVKHHQKMSREQEL